VDDLRSLGGASAITRIGERRTVPGPKSKAIFDHEAKAMAPGLQSIALFSQIVVDHAQGCRLSVEEGRQRLSQAVDSLWFLIDSAHVSAPLSPDPDRLHGQQLGDELLEILLVAFGGAQECLDPAPDLLERRSALVILLVIPDVRETGPLANDLPVLLAQ